MLGGYFTTPQTNPPTPWPAEKFAGLFTKEVQKVLLFRVLNVRRLAGLVTSIASQNGITKKKRVCSVVLHKQLVIQE